MCADHEDDDRGAVPIPEEDLHRVRELRRIAVEALTEANRLLAAHAGVDAGTVDSVTIALRRTAAAYDADGGVPPAWVDPCVQYNSGGACAYYECDPPGVTRPCAPVTLPA